MSITEQTSKKKFLKMLPLSKIPEEVLAELHSLAEVSLVSYSRPFLRSENYQKSANKFAGRILPWSKSISGNMEISSFTGKETPGKIVRKSVPLLKMELVQPVPSGTTLHISSSEASIAAPEEALVVFRDDAPVAVLQHASNGVPDDALVGASEAVQDDIPQNEGLDRKISEQTISVAGNNPRNESSDVSEEPEISAVPESAVFLAPTAEVSSTNLTRASQGIWVRKQRKRSWRFGSTSERTLLKLEISSFEITWGEGKKLKINLIKKIEWKPPLNFVLLTDNRPFEFVAESTDDAQLMVNTLNSLMN